MTAHPAPCPIASFNATLAELGRPWLIEPVIDMPHAFALSTTGPVALETLADYADELGLAPEDFGEIDDYLDPREPWATLGGFALKDNAPETPAEVAAWAAGKLGLTGLLSRAVLEAGR